MTNKKIVVTDVPARKLDPNEIADQLGAKRLTPEEAAKYKKIREQIEEELPDLIARHHERMSKKQKKTLDKDSK